MSGGYRVVPDPVTAHAEVMDGIAGRVGAARPSATAVSGEAFGRLGGLFAGRATQAMGRGDDAVDGLAGTLRDASRMLVATVQAYRLADSDSALVFADIDVPPAAGPPAGGTPPSGPDGPVR